MSFKTTGVGLAAGLGLLSASAGAQELPKSIAWTAYDVGSSGYAQSVAIGSALKNERGVTLRVLPGKNDVSRLAPLREGKVQFSAFGVGAYQAVEAVDTFGTRDWGPQDLYLLSQSNPTTCANLLTAGDIGVESASDLRGKRVSWVKGAPALNHNSYAILRFGDLEWDDVQKVEFGGNAASFQAIIDNQVDAAFTVSTSGNAEQVFSSPRGGVWPATPHDDEEGWARMQKVAPYLFKQMCDSGAGVREPFESVSYPYPVLIAYGEQDEDMVYAMTEAMYDLYPQYKDSAPGASGWGLDNQVFEWVMPWHPGAVRYYKENTDKWTPEAEEHNQRQIERLELLKQAWEEYKADAPSDEAEFAKGWRELRVSTLEDAGFDPVFGVE